MKDPKPLMRVVDRPHRRKAVVRPPTARERALFAAAQIPIEHRYDCDEIRADGTLILRARLRMAILRAIVPRLRAIKRLFTR
jgi:hypothetical protein